MSAEIRRVLVRPRLLTSLLVALCPLALAAAVFAQAPPPSGSYEEERRITAIDLVVGFELDGARAWALATPVPEDLGAGAFEVRFRDQARSIVAVVPEEPWDLVLWFDATLIDTGGLKRIANMLADHAEDLTRLGQVRVVVADPLPALRLPPTREPEPLKAALADIARFGEGRDELVALRAEVVAELRKMKLGTSDLAMSRAELLAGAAGEETRIVAQANDALLVGLTDLETAGPKRAVFLVGDGYDLDPAAFYASLDGAPAEIATPRDLDALTSDLSRTLGSFGWVVIPMSPAEREALREGKTLGKFRFTKPSVTTKTYYDPAKNQDVTQTLLNYFGLRYEGQRKPERAEAYLELGRALHAQGKLAEAEDNLLKALRHWAGHVSTADRQAVAFVELGRILEQEGDLQKARAAYRLARILDPTMAEEELGPSPELIEPMAPLERLAGTTAGRITRDEDGLAETFAGLRRRVRITYQVEGDVDGTFGPVALAYKQQWRGLLYPHDGRHGTPETLTEARLRRLLAGDPPAGTLALDVTLRRADNRRLLTIRFDPRTSGLAVDPREQARFRVSVAQGDPDLPPTIHHELRDPQPLAPDEVWALRQEIAWDVPAVAVVVEDLESGSWGGWLFE